MSMDRHNGVLKSHRVAACLVLSLLAAGAAGYAQNNLTTSACGGEDEPVCGQSDAAYTANWDYGYSSLAMQCDYGLTGDGGFCKDETRHQFSKTLNDFPLGRQIQAQEYSLGADTPVNWLSIMGTHNSFSSYAQGAITDEVADQNWSLSDQLDSGARTLMLDVHYYDHQMRLCHNSFGSDAVNCPLGQTGRLYLFAIKEIAYWLKHNPGEVLFLRLNNTVSDDYDYLLDGPIQAYFGEMAFTRADYSAGKWPTIRELRAMGKQIIVIGSNSTPWIHSWGQYVVNDAEPETKNLAQCWNDDKIDVRTRKYNQFAYIAEDRSRSGSTGDLYSSLFPLLDGCGFSFIDVDFLYSLNKAFADPTTSTVDYRPQASVWSYAPGVDPGTESPMYMLGLKMHAGQKSDVHQFACAGPGTGSDQGAFPAVLYPSHHPWTITKAADIWKNGETTCQAEFGPTYHFWAPGSGIEYEGLVLAVEASGLGFNTTPQTAAFWVNYVGGPVLTGTPNVLSLRWNKTQTSPASAQQMILRGGQGGTLAAVPDDAPQTEFFTSGEVSMVNAHTVSVGLNAQLASNLPIGTYTQLLRVDETDPASGQVNSTRFPVTLQVSDTLLLSSSLVTLGNCFSSLSANVFVKSGGAFTLEPGDSWLHVTADRSTAPATLHITADPTGLLSGLHSGYIKVVAPKATNGGAVIQVNFTVSPQTTISSAPAVAALSYTVDGTRFSGAKTFCWATGTSHTVSAPFTQTFATGSRAQFLAWSDAGSTTHTFIQPGAADDLVANFNVQYRVTTNVNHSAFGTIAASPSSTDGYYNLGTLVSFTAKPESGHSFSDFVFNGTTTSTNPLVLQVTVPVNVLAEFH